MGRLNDKVGELVNADEVEDVCPFCSLRIRIDPVKSTVTHARPTCDRFEALSANEFVVEVRKKLTQDVLSGELGPLKVLKGGSA